MVPVSASGAVAVARLGDLGDQLTRFLGLGMRQVHQYFDSRAAVYAAQILVLAGIERLAERPHSVGSSEHQPEHHQEPRPSQARAIQAE